MQKSRLLSDGVYRNIVAKLIQNVKLRLLEILGDDVFYDGRQRQIRANVLLKSDIDKLVLISRHVLEQRPVSLKEKITSHDSCCVDCFDLLTFSRRFEQALVLLAQALVNSPFGAHPLHI